MAVDPDELAERLRSIAEELADLALERLQRASEAVQAGDQPDRDLLAEEKRITRARRSVERAAGLLSGRGAPVGGGDEGP